MNKLFLLLSFLMGVVVLSSNYLVQFPIKYYGLAEILIAKQRHGPIGNVTVQFEGRLTKFHDPIMPEQLPNNF